MKKKIKKLPVALITVKINQEDVDSFVDDGIEEKEIEVNISEFSFRFI